ncbi:MAG: alcohol dehydrogenase catalytic domain-containing protein [Candidatus Bathyarchaeia archaeon]
MQLVEYGRPLRLVEAPLPELGPRDVLVRVRSCGVCHTDVHLREGSILRGPLPIILGHEVAGEVAAYGEDVDWLKEKMRVLVNYHYACGRCRSCRFGLEEECTNLVSAGFDVDGGYAEYVKAPAVNLLEIPEEISYEEASVLACGGGTIYHAMKCNPPRVGEAVVVYGFGGLGVFALQLAKLAGATTFVVDVSEEKLELAQRLGADHTVNASKKDVAGEVRRLTNGSGAHKVFDLVSAPTTLESSLKMLRRHGRLIVIGALTELFYVDPYHLLRNRLEIHGQGGCPSYELEELLQLVKVQKVRPIVSKTYPLEEANRALEDLRAGLIIGRAVIKP